MNWTRGLLRAWMIVAGIWVAGVASVVVMTVRNAPRAEAPAISATAEHGPWEAYQPSPSPRVNFAAVGVTALGPPAVLFALGLAGVWIARGFRRDW
jgi:hypothetical protein